MVWKIKLLIYWFYDIFLRIFNLSYRLYCKDISLDLISNSTSFFGYYNVSPENEKGHVLYHEVKGNNVRQSKYEQANLNLLNDDVKLTFASSLAWNWQQGSMLQWLPSSQFNKIIYNDYSSNDDKYKSVVYNMESQNFVEYEKPIYSISRCGKFGLSLNFDRLKNMRPDYGYFQRKIETVSDENDGIWRLDFDSGNVDFILSLNELKLFNKSDSMIGASHKVNHIDISPSSKRFIFLHRWIGPKGRYTRLLSCDIDGENLCLLNGDEMTSHCCWLNDTEILAFCSYKNISTGYFKFLDLSEKVENYSEYLPEVDGHPSISPNKKWILTDCYPGRNRFSSLFLMNVKSKKLYKLGDFYQPVEYMGEKRIDLHPKWNTKGDSVYFESGHDGKRKLYKINLGDFFKNEN